LAAAGERVLIVDVDAHHGNGTQDIFYERDDVAYVSWHQHPLYPGTGGAEEFGSGEGEGTTLNLPMPPDATGDHYRRSIEQIVAPFSERFGSTWLVISAGFDAHRRDPLTDLGLTSGDFADITADLVQLVDPGRRLVFLEGGYDLRAVADSGAATIGALVGERLHPEPPTSGGPGSVVVDRVAELRRRYDR
jgi:acetoin utilization deacetylase AcuC-like enzyme